MCWAISVVCAALGLFEAPPSRPPWVIVRSQDGDFAFSMPAKPEMRSRQEGVSGTAVETLTYDCSAGGCEYSLRRMRNPRSIDPGRVVAQLARVKEDRVGSGGRIVRETPITVDGVIGHDFTYSVHPSKEEGGVNRRTRIFVGPQFSYELTVSAAPGRPLPDDATRFLSSLTFEAVVRANLAAARAGIRPASGPKPAAAGIGPRLEGRGTSRATKIRVVDGTPEQALETFLLALAAHDEEALRAVSLPDDEFDLLLKDRPPPATPRALAAMKEGFERKPFRRLAAGHRVRMPGGKIAVIKPADVSAGRAVLMPEGAPLPARVEDVRGHWKVLPRTFIMVRKAAEAASKKNRNRPPEAGDGPGS